MFATHLHVELMLNAVPMGQMLYVNAFLNILEILTRDADQNVLETQIVR